MNSSLTKHDIAINNPPVTQQQSYETILFLKELADIPYIDDDIDNDDNVNLLSIKKRITSEFEIKHLLNTHNSNYKNNLSASQKSKRSQKPQEPKYKKILLQIFWYWDCSSKFKKLQVLFSVVKEFLFMFKF